MSILSVTLFNIKINCITKCFTPGIDDYLYVDFCNTSRSKYTLTFKRQLQQCIRKITHWVNTNCFRISKGKPWYVHFCQLRKMHNDPLIKLGDTKIPVVDEYKFLGVIFDRKLTFIPYIKYLKTKSIQAQQLLRVVVHTEYSADQWTRLNYTDYWSVQNYRMPFLSTDIPGGFTSNSLTLYTTKA